ncbi:hypothetical protein ACL02O_16125 [Micromonospora sp. MS34]
MRWLILIAIIVLIAVLRFWLVGSAREAGRGLRRRIDARRRPDGDVR